MGVARETQIIRDWEDSSAAEHDVALRQELLATVYASLPVALLASLFNGALVVAIFDGAVPRSHLVGWYALMLTMVAVRMVLWRRYLRHRHRWDAGTLRHWQRLAVVGSAISGLLWGAAGIAFGIATGEMGHLVMGFLLGGMGAGAVAALTPVLPAFYAFLLPAVVPFALGLTVSGERPHLGMAAACVVYLFGIILLGRQFHQLLVQSLRLRFENTDLVRTLEERVRQRTDALEAINARLSLDISERRRAEAALEQSAARQSAVARFGERALSGAELETLFPEALDLVRTLLDVPRAAILESAADGRSVIIHLAADGDATAAAVACPPEGEAASPAGYALMTRKPVISADLAKDVRFAVPPFLAAAGMVSVLDVVIAGGRRPFGVLEASDRQRHHFTAADVAFLESIANMLAAAIDRKSAERNIQQMALRDPLTGLPNRAVFHDQLLQALARVRRSGGALAILLLDLDYFKDVNDTLGHSAGDRLLVDLAHRLRACTRQSEPPARLGGDEFALILTDLKIDSAVDIAATVAQKIGARLAEPFIIDGQDVHIGVSIGITLHPGDGAAVDQLMRNADLALYRAKFDGRGNFRFYSADMSVQIERRKAVEADLRRALARDEFDLYYQPQVDLASEVVVGAEALLRWQHPKRGLLQPAEFLSVAETRGLLGLIGNWVVERACRDARECRRRGLASFSTAINVSPGECRGDELAETVERIAGNLGCDVGWLELEVTEEMFHPPERGDSLRSLARLRDQGVKVSIDDFGTGYSNLARLHTLPVDRVKIDRSFVAGVGQHRDAEQIIRAMITLASNLGLEVVAEGVETQAQLDFLRAEGCHRAQGFRLGPPRPFDEFIGLLGTNVGTRQTKEDKR